jgi:hypothetical protein
LKILYTYIINTFLYYVCAILPASFPPGRAGLVSYLFTRNYCGVTPLMIGAAGKVSDVNKVTVAGLAVDIPIILFLFLRELL